MISVSVRRVFGEAWRQHLRHKGRFAAAATIFGVSLALSAGLFAVTDALLFRPLSFPNPDALYYGPTSRGEPGVFGRPLNDYDIKALTELPSIESAGGFGGRVFDARLADPENIRSVSVTPGFFETLGADPFSPSGLSLWQAGTSDVPLVVVGRGLARRLDVEDAVPGTILRVAGRDVRFVGVAPVGFDFPRGANLWVRQADSTMRRYSAVLRLRAAASQITVGTLAQPMRVDRLDRFDRMAGTSSPALVGAMAMTGVIAVFVYQGLAWLSFVVSRGRERALRKALGATDAQLSAETIAEISMVLLAGALLGAGLLPATLGATLHLLPSELTAGRGIRIDFRVLAFVVLLAGSAIALLAVGATHLGDKLSRWPVNTLLGSPSPLLAPGMTGHVLVFVLQTAVVTGCGYVSLVGLRSYVATSQQDLGFAPDNLISIGLPSPAFRTLSQPLRAQLRESIARLEGVRSVAAGSLPISRTRMPVSVTTVPANETSEVTVPPRNADNRWVGSGYFTTVGTQIVMGEGFDGREVARGAVVLSETLARRIANGRPLVGQLVWVNGSAKLVKGIAADVWAYGPEAGPAPIVYTLNAYAGDFVVRTAVPASSLRPALQEVVSRVTGEHGRMEISSASDRLDVALRPQRAQAILLGATAIFSVLVGAASLSTSASAFARGRLKSVTIRIALGSSPRAAVTRLLTGLMSAAAAGLTLGLFSGVLTARAASNLWYGVRPLDAFSSVCSSLIGVAIIVVVVWRLSRVLMKANPVELLSQ